MDGETVDGGDVCRCCPECVDRPCAGVREFGECNLWCWCHTGLNEDEAEDDHGDE